MIFGHVKINVYTLDRRKHLVPRLVEVERSYQYYIEGARQDCRWRLGRCWHAIRKRECRASLLYYLIS